MKNLGMIFGSKFSVDTAERVNGNMGRSAGEFLDNLPEPEAGSEAKLLVATADCKGVPLVKEDREKVAAFETGKKNPGNRRMATVTSVYSVDPNVRTAEDIVAVPILDILHALSYVWKAANLFAKDEQSRRSFTRERLLKILRGEVTGVIQGLRSLGTRRGLKGEKLKTLRQICGYLEKNSDRMRYDEYLRRGYPIASGVIEGACRHLVKDRMERSGMRWTLEGARSMLNVRAAFQSDHWRTFIDWHIEHEVTQTHPNRHLLQDYTPLTLAC